MSKLGRICLTLFLLLPAIKAYADSKATALFEHTLLATINLNYQGVFVLQTGDKLQTIRIFHRKNTGGESVRLIALDGLAREFVRNNDAFACVHPEGQASKHSMLGLGFPDSLIRRLNKARHYYHMHLGKESRIAGRQADELKLISIDNNRYDYHLWVAKDTGMLLQSSLVDDTGRVLRKLAFSLIDVGTDIADDAFQLKTQGYKYSWRSIRNLHAKVTDRKAEYDCKCWLPEGFVLVNQNRLKAISGEPVKHMVYSDGLSSISIFIEKMRLGHNYLPVSMSSKIGIASTSANIVGKHFVTVIGEMPAATVEKVAGSIRYEGITND